MFKFGKAKSDPYGISPDRRKQREPLMMDHGDPVTIRLARKISTNVSGSAPRQTVKRRVSHASLFLEH
ncbi:MAG: hypothetical protein GYB42_04725 [Alphaproteobacteria bacterium]|jgi:hypothetical protein|nr:hypothetical protein [Alphaproteobacteria bacterium]